MMKFEKTELDGVYIITREPFTDERGTFARMFCKREFEAMGLCGDIAQVSMSTNTLKGTLRGLHCQTGEFAEDKFVTCVRGSVYDVAVDVRENSKSFGRWIAAELSAEAGNALYLQKGFAHGFLTLTDDTWVQYLMTQFYQPGAAGGFRYDDPDFGVAWPGEILVINEKDNSWPLLSQRQSGAGW